ncbi:FAD binding domain-containing protein [Haloechinothrix sp. YIM 98757]|uniref:FAD binding domain-containing protein n=1 Tax=Haloechinothrix aidingensis TaxID=2752311 RepID=A0A838AD87_9PSEU|nr:FAD binding domain-containing protein [Haloechinothrix aidingensis]
MSTTLAPGEVRLATSLAEATAMLAELGEDGEAIAGGTWTMRASQRHDVPRRAYVALKRLPELHGVAPGDPVDVGALTTHTELAAADARQAFECVRSAARQSAFPQVRNVATVGGNINAIGFPEADLVPALLAAEAQLELYSPEGNEVVGLADYLTSRDARPAGELITRVRVPAPSHRRSAFERLTVRATGEYPIVNVAVSADISDGVVRTARIAVGSVEPVAKLCSAATELVGRSTDELSVTDAVGEAVAAELTPRHGRDAPAWYRTAVLPALIRRALARLTTDPE